jgi:capsid protein
MILEEAVGRGFIEAKNFYQFRRAWTRCNWIFDGAGWLDPVREAQAAELRMAIGISTLQDECGEQGRDWEEVLEQRAAEQARMRALCLDLSALQTSVSVAPQVPIDENRR